MSDNPFAGTWQLVSSEMRTADGNIFYPLGEGCAGRMFCDNEGNLSAQLMQVDRTKFASDDMMQGTAEEVVSAYKGFVSFWGAYKFDPQAKEARYVIEGSLFPNWVGHENLRFYEREGDCMTLKTPPFPMAGQKTEGVLIWQRIG